MIITTIIYRAILSDVRQDKKNILIVKKDSVVFDNWECGYECNTSKFKVFKGEKYTVLRIRYGKDFMALKIESKNGISGWAILDEKFEITDSSKI